jgi:hypothetical protein
MSSDIFDAIAIEAAAKAYLAAPIFRDPDHGVRAMTAALNAAIASMIERDMAIECGWYSTRNGVVIPRVHVSQEIFEGGNSILVMKA